MHVNRLSRTSAFVAIPLALLGLLTIARASAAAQYEITLSPTECGGGLVEACGDRTESTCKWKGRWVMMSFPPFLAYLPWRVCEPTTHTLLFKNQSRGEPELFIQ